MVYKKDSLDNKTKIYLRIGTVYREFINGEPSDKFIIPINYTYLKIFSGCKYDEFTGDFWCRNTCNYRRSIYLIAEGHKLIPYTELAPCWKNLYPNNMMLQVGNPNKSKEDEYYSMKDILYRYLSSDLQKDNIAIEGIGIIKRDRYSAFSFVAYDKHRYNPKGYVRIRNLNS